MAFGETWNENIPNDNTLAKNIDDEVRSTKTAIRERLEVEHDFAADESGITTIGQHKKGSARVGFGTAEEKPANNADNPGLLYLTLADVDADEEVTQLEIIKVELDTGTEWKTLAGINWNIYEADGVTVKESTSAKKANHGTQLFTSTGTFTVPDCGTETTTVWITAIGGGGGGGGSDDDIAHYGGGGGSGVIVFKKAVTGLTPGDTVNVTVGAGGSRGNIQLNGGQGGTSSFGAHVSALGGYGGTPGTSTFNGVPGSSRGNGSFAGSGYNGANSILGYGAGGDGGHPGPDDLGVAGSPGAVLVEW
jgi:hypothetical protein